MSRGNLVFSSPPLSGNVAALVNVGTDFPFNGSTLFQFKKNIFKRMKLSLGTEDEDYIEFKTAAFRSMDVLPRDMISFVAFLFSYGYSFLL